METPKALAYSDITLIAGDQPGMIASRTLCSTEVQFLGHTFKLPVVPANMEDVIDEKTASILQDKGYFYIMHRFSPRLTAGKTHRTYKFVEWANKELDLVSISVGVNQDSKDILQYILKDRLKVDFITIDVAHGHHIKVREMLAWIKERFSSTKVIAGNVMTHEGYSSLCEWGADAVKVGIGQGSICTTRLETGFGMPMFSCIRDIVNKGKTSVPIIADGGVEHCGDIAKAIVAGADMVMCGQLFATCIDSAAEHECGKVIYRGSTSFEAKRSRNCIEGRTLLLNDVPLTILERMSQIKQGLQSSISYTNKGFTLQSLKGTRWRTI